MEIPKKAVTKPENQWMWQFWLFLANFCKNGWIPNLGYQKWYAHGLKFIWCGTYDFLSEITMKYSKYQNLAVFGYFLQKWLNSESRISKEVCTWFKVHSMRNIWLLFRNNNKIFKISKSGCFWLIFAKMAEFWISGTKSGMHIV